MITSLSNPRLKRVIKLKKKAKARTQDQVFIIEGVKLFLEAPEELIKEVYITPEFLIKYVNNFHDKLERCTYEIVSEDIFARMADTKTPQGILCVVRQQDCDLVNEEAAQPYLYLLLEDIHDPGNLGTIIRTAEAAGITGVIMSRDCADIYNPKTVRATMGSIFRVPFTYTDDLQAVISELKNRNIEIYAACLEDAETYDSFDYRGGAAFLIGSESQGLSDEVKNGTINIKIPMSGQVESLNAATAATVLLYEATRQRRSTP